MKDGKFFIFPYAYRAIGIVVVLCLQKIQEDVMQIFANRFRFNPATTLNVGIERECFLTRGEGNIVPLASDVLRLLSDRQRFGYELSACQLEDRVGPCIIGDLSSQFALNEQEIQRAEAQLGFERLYIEVAPESMPLDVFPDPTGRYQEITTNMPRETLLAACRVAATHIHVGMPSHAVALSVYNMVIKHLDRLCQLGDRSDGQRLQIYHIMAPDYLPRPYADWEKFYEEACEKKFDGDPRRCWHLIRLSVHGTIEFRMFGSTPDVEQIVLWADDCRRLCEEAMTV
ncbi:MAG: hypothetical protein Q7R79_03950 [bacterium]|nr:hypothetical protein [bacterium]